MTMPRLIAIAFCAALGPKAAAQAQAQAQEQEQAGGAPGVVVLARLGKLRDDEVSPRAGSQAPVLWRTALDGVTLAQVDAGTEIVPDRSMEDLRRALLPAGARASLMDLSPARGAPPRGLPPAVAKLREVFRAPPPPGVKEFGAVESLRKALGARETVPARPDELSQAGSITDPGLLFREAAASSPGVILVRVVAEDDLDEAVGRRDGVLKSILDAAGADAQVLVLNLPGTGPGTLVARGPRFKKARVILRNVGLSSVRATLASLLGQTAPKEAGSAAEEPIREIFK